MGWIQHGAVSRGISQCYWEVCRSQTETLRHTSNRKLESSPLMSTQQCIRHTVSGMPLFHKRDVSLKHLCTWISKSFFFSLINGGQTILISVSSGTTSKIQVQLLPHAGNKPALMIWHSKNVPIKNTRYWTKRGSQKEEVRIHLVKVTSPSITKLKSICKAEAAVCVSKCPWARH